MSKNLNPDIQKIAKEEFISNYDLNEDYLYKDFWKGREYEHKAEMMLIARILKRFVYFKKTKKQMILDLGGSFGRLADLYASRFKYSIIGDYSMQELEEAKKRLFARYSKLYLIGLNAYKMPFKDNSIDVVLSVRLAHHIRYLDILAQEVYRILKPGGILILEAAHKNHLKAILRAIIKRELSFFRKNIIKVKHDPHQAQVIKEIAGQIPIMYNFSAKFVINTFVSKGFKIRAAYPCSFFRLPLLKKIVPLPVLLGLERFLQHLSFLKITPSLFYVFYKPIGAKVRVADGKVSQQSKVTTKQCKDLKDILQCPGGGKLAFEYSDVLCDNKETEMKRLGPREYDLRDPRPDKIKF